MTIEWIDRACKEALDKRLVYSDAHAEALKLVIQAHYEASHTVEAMCKNLLLEQTQK